MAENKKSFLLYCDVFHTVSHLSDDQAGKLFKHILGYVNDKDPQTDDVIINLAFEPIKQQLKRDLKKWVGEKKQRSAAGKKGMAKRWGKNKAQKITKHNTVTDPITNITDNVTVDVDVNVNDTVIDIHKYILNKIEISKTVEFCSITLQREYTGDRVAELWKAFLINGQKPFYESNKKRVEHFRNWIKTQPYGTYKQTSADGTKLGTGAARIEALKKW